MILDRNILELCLGLKAFSLSETPDVKELYSTLGNVLFGWL